MKVYNKLVIDMETGVTLEEDSFEYTGPVAECKGGSTSTTTVDKKYNARMADIAEENNDWARQMFNTFIYGVDYDPTEVTDPVNGKTAGEMNGYDWTTAQSEYNLMKQQIAGEFEMDPLRRETEKLGLGLQQKQIGAAESLLSQQTETERLGLGLKQKQISSEEQLLPQYTDTTRLKLEADAASAKDRMKSIQERAPVISKLYEEALSGVDVNRRVSEARGQVEQGFASAQDSMSRDMSRYGVSMNSGRAASNMRNIGIAKASSLAGASTAAQNQAEAESFNMKKTALGLPLA